MMTAASRGDHRVEPGQSDRSGDVAERSRRRLADSITRPSATPSATWVALKPSGRSSGSALRAGSRADRLGGCVDGAGRFARARWTAPKTVISGFRVGFPRSPDSDHTKPTASVSRHACQSGQRESDRSSSSCRSPSDSCSGERPGRDSAFRSQGRALPSVGTATLSAGGARKAVVEVERRHSQRSWERVIGHVPVMGVDHAQLGRHRNRYLRL